MRVAIVSWSNMNVEQRKSLSRVRRLQCKIDGHVVALPFSPHLSFDISGTFVIGHLSHMRVTHIQFPPGVTRALQDHGDWGEFRVQPNTPLSSTALNEDPHLLLNRADNEASE